MPVVLRRAEDADANLVMEMLVVAVFWRPDGPAGSVDAVAADPQLSHYAADWPRPGDLGVVAYDDRRPVGAAWLRLLPATDPGYGFIDAATPELAIGVVERWRGRGIGRMLLDALIATARDHGHAALSLSVEVDNPARRLYERVGFRQIADADGALTMLLNLGRTS